MPLNVVHHLVRFREGAHPSVVTLSIVANVEYALSFLAFNRERSRDRRFFLKHRGPSKKRP
jgi:hypothetical protein